MADTEHRILFVVLQMIVIFLACKTIASLILLSFSQMIHSQPLNGTGGNFAQSVYKEATFQYEFDAGNNIYYAGEGASTGKCNIQGYWHSGNIDMTFPFPPASKPVFSHFSWRNNLLKYSTLLRPLREDKRHRYLY